MSRGLMRIGTSDSLSQAQRKITQGVHDDPLGELDREQNDQRRQVEAHRDRRKTAADGTQHGLGDAPEKADDRVVGVRVHPAEHGPGDDDPEVRLEREVGEPRHREDEVAQEEHALILSSAPPPHPRPSSRDRWVARSTAWMNVVRIPPSSRAAMPAIEVPPGELTMSLSAPGWRPVSRRSFAAPRTVWVASVIAVIRSSPIFTPPSASDSITTATYAGPEPDRPVTASSSSSSSTTTRPTALKISPAMSRSPGSRPSALAIAVTPSRTSAGVFGMTRIRRASLPSAARILAVETPAAIEMTSLRRVTTEAISFSTGSMICGFTAMMTTSAWRTSSVLLAAIWIPYCRSSSLSRSRRTSVA